MRSNRATRRAGVSMAATLPLLAGALAFGIPAAHAADGPSRDTLSGTKPAWATATADKGAASDSSQVSARVYLAYWTPRVWPRTPGPCPTRTRPRTAST